MPSQRTETTGVRNGSKADGLYNPESTAAFAPAAFLSRRSASGHKPPSPEPDQQLLVGHIGYRHRGVRTPRCLRVVALLVRMLTDRETQLLRYAIVSDRIGRQASDETSHGIENGHGPGPLARTASLATAKAAVPSSHFVLLARHRLGAAGTPGGDRSRRVAPSLPISCEASAVRPDG